MFFGGPAVAAAWTIAVGFEAASVLPFPSVAVTCARMRWPTSAASSLYVWPVAPDTGGQFDPSGAPPSAPQRTHWYVNVIGELLDQPPLVVVRVCPWTTEPLTLGSDVCAGPDAAFTTAV